MNQFTVRQIRCGLFASNIYILETNSASESIWLVDCGDGCINIPPNKSVKGVFITHPHIDHISGLNDLLKRFPELTVYCSKGCWRDLFDSKRNLSFYHENPFIYKGHRVHFLKEGDSIHMCDGIDLIVYETPGHNANCLSYKVNNYLFTGDSYIPNYPIVTKLKGGDKELAQVSKQRILSLIGDSGILCPGHEDMLYV